MKHRTTRTPYPAPAGWTARAASRCRPPAGKSGILFVGVLFLALVPCRGANNPGHQKSLEVIATAIEALGGEAYLGVKTAHSTGRYFWFRKGRKAFARFTDWTVYEPVKFRFLIGEEKKGDVFVYNLELGKGWKREGKSTVEELPADQIEDFRGEVKRDLDVLLRQRVHEEGMSLFYYGPEEIAGQGEYEAVEFLDTSNDSVVVFFNRKTHLPHKLETRTTDNLGIRHKEEQEFYNWHVIQGVHTPLRFDSYVDGELSSQKFVETITYNQTFPPELFLEPKVEK